MFSFAKKSFFFAAVIMGLVCVFFGFGLCFAFAASQNYEHLVIASVSVGFLGVFLLCAINFIVDFFDIEIQ